MSLFDATEMLAKFCTNPIEDIAKFVGRDFLNILLFNSDVHGRNSSLIKRDKSVALAPIHDLAPMAYHRDGIVRYALSHWEDWDAAVPPYLQIGAEIENRCGSPGIAESVQAEMNSLIHRLGGAHKFLRRELELAEVGPELTSRMIDNFRGTLEAITAVMQQTGISPRLLAKLKETSALRYCAAADQWKNPRGKTKLTRLSSLCSWCDPKNITKD